ncbi:MAG: hypothetical protein H6713_39220 [Myxococcales bacterium]|nr:hypothetical protein [Myxococcales bacterium]
MSRRRAGALALALASATLVDACSYELHDDLPDDLPMGAVIGAPASARRDATGCLADDEAFVHRALARLQGRPPRGVREARVLADYVAQLDAAGLDGRRLLARGLTDDPRFVQRWRVVLEELIELPRGGGRGMTMCHGPARAAGEDAALAEHVRDHDPDEAFGEPWGLGDLIESSLRLDDVTPALRARLLTRMIAPIQGNNVTAEELERARRTNFGRSFEALLLGRRGECLACHNDEASVTDHADPALDRFWPHPARLDRAVYGDSRGRAEEEVHAAFRYAGFADDGWLAPWGARDCGALAPGYEGDLLEVPAYLAGPLPAGATALDVEARLRLGLERLRDDGPVTAAADAAPTPEEALAMMVAMRLVDSAWAQLAGARLTMAHGYPRNEGQRDALLELTARFVDSGFSPRTLAVELVVHPALNQAPAGECAAGSRLPEGDASAPLPALFDPYAPERDPERPGNGLGDALHRRDPWALLDRASQALDWATPGRFPYPYAWEDEALLRGLGARLSEEELGQRGLDWGALLMWESRAAEGLDPGFAGPRHAALEGAGEGDLVDRLLDHADAQARASFGELAAALADRVLGAPAIASEERALLEALTGMSWETSVHARARGELEDAARRVVGALLATPEFMIAGLYPSPQDETPRLVLPEDTTRALCERRLPALLASVPDAPGFRCDDDGVTLLWSDGGG